MRGSTSVGYDQFETSPETIEQELRPPVCERRPTDRLKEQIEDKTTSLLVQIDNRIRMLVMLQIMMLNIGSPVYVITKISAIISRYLTAKFEQ